MNHFLRHFCALSLCGLSAMSLQAQELRMGFVSTDRVLKEAGSDKSVQIKFEQEFAKRKKDLQDQEANLKALADKFEREAPTLPETQRQARQKQLLEQDRDFQTKRRRYQEDLNVRNNEELQLVIQRANKAIKDIAVTEKYDFIFQDVVYVHPKFDITDKVIKALNAPAAK